MARKTVNPQELDRDRVSGQPPALLLPLLSLSAGILTDHPSVHACIHLSLDPPIHSSIHPGSQSIYPSSHPLTRPPLHLFMHPGTHSSILPPILGPTHPFIHSCTHPSIHPPIHPTTHPSIHSSIHLISKTKKQA